MSKVARIKQQIPDILHTSSGETTRRKHLLPMRSAGVDTRMWISTSRLATQLLGKSLDVVKWKGFQGVCVGGAGVHIGYCVYARHNNFYDCGKIHFKLSHEERCGKYMESLISLLRD